MGDIDNSLREYASVILKEVDNYQYEESRGELLELIKRKIDRKAYLIRLQDDEPTKERNNALNGLESEIATLIGVVKSFDRMAGQLRAETLKAQAETDRVKDKVKSLTKLLKIDSDSSNVWPDMAFKLHQYATQILPKRLTLNGK